MEYKIKKDDNNNINIKNTILNNLIVFGYDNIDIIVEKEILNFQQNPEKYIQKATRDIIIETIQNKAKKRFCKKGTNPKHVNLESMSEARKKLWMDKAEARLFKTIQKLSPESPDGWVKNSKLSQKHGIKVDIIHDCLAWKAGPGMELEYNDEIRAYRLLEQDSGASGVESVERVTDSYLEY